MYIIIVVLYTYVHMCTCRTMNAQWEIMTLGWNPYTGVDNRDLLKQIEENGLKWAWPKTSSTAVQVLNSLQLVAVLQWQVFMMVFCVSNLANSLPCRFDLIMYRPQSQRRGPLLLNVTVCLSLGPWCMCMCVCVFFCLSVHINSYIAVVENVTGQLSFSISVKNSRK